MKYLPSTFLASVMGERQMQRNIAALLRYLLVLTAIVVIYAVIFHFIMWNIEGQRHSWITGVYWALTVMSTLGFGDITFQSDLGRVFSLFVLLSGIVLLLIVLPFVFIRNFYAPWLEAQIRLRAPRSLPDDVRNHVVITGWESIASGLAERLPQLDVPYVVVEPDPALATQLHADGISVVTAELDGRHTYERLRVASARLVLANSDDTTNTNVILTVREVAPEARVAAVASVEDAVDILQLAGASHVLPLKQRLGEQLARRVNAGRAEPHVIGSFRDLLIAEFPVHNTPFCRRAIRDIRLREATGLNIVGVWEGARLEPAHPDTILTESCAPVVVGTQEQIERLDELLVIYDANPSPILIIGGGKVGRSAARDLKRRGVSVHMVERKAELADRIGDIPERLFIGDAARFELMMEAGVAEAPSILLTTNDDAMNIYLTVYCRRLNPEARIVSRITHEANVTAIRRAGADLALSYASLGVETVIALLQGRELVFLGEGVELEQVPVPRSLAGESLAESQIRARTGFNVIAIEDPAGQVAPAGPDSRLETGSRLLMIGEPDALKTFLEVYGRNRG